MSDLRFIHDDRFVEAFANRDHVVLGKRLDPFCLWHQFNLEVAQSKILLGAALTPFDLWLAVRICTSPWTPGHSVPNLAAPSKLRFIWEVGRFDFKAEVAKFQAYYDDYNSGPKFWPNQHKEQMGAPDRDFDENLELALHLKQSGNFSWRDVWTLPLGMMRWNSVGLAKLQGNKVDIWTPEHQRMFDEHVVRREASIDERGKAIAAEKNIPFEEARKQAHEEYWARVKNNLAHANEQSKQQQRHGS